MIYAVPSEMPKISDVAYILELNAATPKFRRILNTTAKAIRFSPTK